MEDVFCDEVFGVVVVVVPRSDVAEVMLVCPHVQMAVQVVVFEGDHVGVVAQ